MLRDELDMLQCRLEAMEDWDVTTVVVEAPVTHRGVPKPLAYSAVGKERFARWADRIIHVVADLPDLPDPADAGEDAPDPEAAREHKRLEAWMREHAQRQAAWPVIARHAGPGDVVLICDVDEIPSPALLAWDGPDVVAARMRTCLFAVDWEVPQALIPPTCVAATAGYLHQRLAEHCGLGQVRDARSSYPVLADGGWHLSWTGGPQRQREKLETATCHTELLSTAEGQMIRDGTRWRTSQDGGGLPVEPVDVDETWPAYVYERRCPANWFRPRASAVGALGGAPAGSG